VHQKGKFFNNESELAWNEKYEKLRNWESGISYGWRITRWRRFLIRK
jgi:hypothetical protein